MQKMGDRPPLSPFRYLRFTAFNATQPARPPAGGELGDDRQSRIGRGGPI
jgi:hypothetical protein